MKLTYQFILITVAVFIAYTLFPPLAWLLALDPASALSGAYWQFITYMFVHGNINLLNIGIGPFLNSGLFHLTINMFVLFIFGTVVEREIGKKDFAILYLASGVGSAFLHIILTALQFGITDIGLVGASGAVFGVLAVYGLFYPRNIIIIFPGIPLPAIIAIIGIAGFEILMGITGLEPGIANFGHLGGIIFGVAFALFWRKYKRRKPIHGDFEFYWE